MSGKSDQREAREKTESVEQRLLDAEAEFDALFDAAVDAVIEIDEQGRIQRFNRAAEKIFGYRAEEVYDHNVHILMPEPYQSEHDGYIQRYQRTGEARIIGIGREVVGRHKDGSTFPIELSVGEATVGGRPAYLGLIRDISARKCAEAEAQDMRERLTHVARVGMMGEMASGLAHELNQPLTAISSYASACRRMLENTGMEVRDNELLTETLGKIASQAERAGQIIWRLRGLIKKGETQQEPVEPERLIRDLMRIAEVELRERGLTFDLKLEPDLPAVIGDAVQIQQVLLNLIRNAAEAMTEVHVGQNIDILGRVRGGFLEITVSDRGPGIAEEMLPRVFEPFFTTKHEGLGMGLALCRSIMENHEGDLVAANNRYGGANFTLKLPLSRK